MLSEQAHIIRRQILHVDVQGMESDGLVVQRKLPLLCQNDLSAMLEGVLDQAVAPDEHVIIERLDIEAGSFLLEHLEHDLAAAVSVALQKALRESQITASSSTANGVQRRTAGQSVQEAFLCFLESGHLPWWFHVPPGRTLEELAIESWDRQGETDSIPHSFVGTLANAIRSEQVRKRLILQFSLSFQTRVLDAISPQGSRIWQKVLASNHGAALPRVVELFLQRISDAALSRAMTGESVEADILVAECWHTLQQTERQAPELVTYLRQHAPELLVQLEPHTTKDHAAAEGVAGNVPSATDSKRAPHKTSAVSNDGESNEARDSASLRDTRHVQAQSVPSSEHTLEKEFSIFDNESKRVDVHPTDGEPALKEGLFVPNAGVILLHPFLSGLFEALNITRGTELVEPDCALRILHFLATGQRVAPEYDLVLAKILCNVPLDAPVDSLSALTIDEAQEANAMLDAVISHWEALRNTSRDGLRGTFLTRPGKLSEREDGDYLLQVEAQSFDILLEELPWGIGVVKLPWMPKLLWVEWH